MAWRGSPERRGSSGSTRPWSLRSRAGPVGLAARQGPSVRAFLLQRADRRTRAGLECRVRAVLLVRCLQPRRRSPRSTSGFRTAAAVDFLNEKTESSVAVFLELQSLGELRGDIVLGSPNADEFPYVWLLTQDSKASRIHPAAVRHEALVRGRAASARRCPRGDVADPVAVSRAIRSLAHARRRGRPAAAVVFCPIVGPEVCSVPGTVWGEGVTKIHRLTVNEALLDWAKAEPIRSSRAPGLSADRHNAGDDAAANRLLRVLSDMESAAGAITLPN